MKLSIFNGINFTKYQNISILQFLWANVFIFYMKHNSLLCFYVSLFEMMCILLLHYFYYSLKLTFKYDKKRFLLYSSFFVNLYLSCWTYILLFFIFQDFNVFIVTTKIIVNIYYLKNWYKIYLCYINGSRKFFPPNSYNYNYNNYRKKLN